MERFAQLYKACSPTGEFVQETEPLQHFAGHGMARLLERNSETEVMLLERLQPGTMLRNLPDGTSKTPASSTTPISPAPACWRRSKSNTCSLMSRCITEI